MHYAHRRVTHGRRGGEHAQHRGDDEKTGRKFYLDDPDDLKPGEKVTFLLNLHGGGSVGAWQRAYFPAVDFKDKYRLVIATPSAATKEPARRWVGEADDAHLRNIAEMVFDKYGSDNIERFWLVGHSPGRHDLAAGSEDPFFQDRVDGWLSLSGGRIGVAERAPNFGPPDRNSRPGVEMSFTAKLIGFAPVRVSARKRTVLLSVALTVAVIAAALVLSARGTSHGSTSSTLEVPAPSHGSTSSTLEAPAPSRPHPIVSFASTVVRLDDELAFSGSGFAPFSRSPERQCCVRAVSRIPVHLHGRSHR